MGKEILAIPEEQLSVVVDIIDMGLAVTSVPRNHPAWQGLYTWCREMEEYIDSIASAFDMSSVLDKK